MHNKNTLHSNKSTNVRLFIFHTIARTLSHFSPWLAARLAARIFRTTKRSTPPHREAAWAEAATRLHVNGRHGPIATWSWGSGESTVLLVHGWSGRGLQLGAFATALVERGFRVVAFDAPGHGETKGSTSSMPVIARAATDVAEAVGGVDMVVGHSLGCVAALFAINNEGLSCRSIAMVAPAGSMSSVARQFSELSGFSPDVVARMILSFEQQYDFTWSAIEPIALIQHLRLPILIVHDHDDRETPWSAAEKLASANPTTHFVSTTGLGHRRILRDAAVVEAVTDFVHNQSNTQVA